MNAADVWCDSFVWFVYFVVAQLRLDHRVQPNSNQTQWPPSHRTAESAIHPSRWWPTPLNANDCVNLAAGVTHPSQNPNHRRSG